MTISVRLFDRLNNTPAAELATRGWLECVEKGWTDGSLNASSDQKAFVAYVENGREVLPAGVMTWKHFGDTNEIYVFQSFVVPEFRGRGVYTALWQSMVSKAIDLKASAICSGTHSQNRAMRTIAAKQGRREQFVMLRFDLD
jgi:GNAT superfamily N-acetyltransferase